ncbi:MAG: DUF378 domain-containing protein [Candidatus Paracaedimonas acanthamoebae]|mgnify:CR=1 FL=1|uniref:DUF378 domain-containing protein n=1 Tax=Candidatus Paracaedimonas acanthamoebae TaxID=244581 RepID=A0A8J7PRS6_9PROT|nr:DUF378 domain-containing protein [Holosporales bacterium]MBN9412299.1 DUF378 domain-containing protein [Candidatus Paracaedimonas acanthamoebae]
MINAPHTTVRTFSYYSRLFANILVIIGAINWGLVGTIKFDLVAFLFGEVSAVSRVVYALVGLSGLYLLPTLAQRSINN